VAQEFGQVQITAEVAEGGGVLISVVTSGKEPGPAPSSGSNHLNAEHPQMRGLKPSGE
jgi:hypothetical protein